MSSNNDKRQVPFFFPCDQTLLKAFEVQSQCHPGDITAILTEPGFFFNCLVSFKRVVEKNSASSIGKGWFYSIVSCFFESFRRGTNGESLHGELIPALKLFMKDYMKKNPASWVSESFVAFIYLSALCRIHNCHICVHEYSSADGSYQVWHEFKPNKYPSVQVNLLYDSLFFYPVLESHMIDEKIHSRLSECYHLSEYSMPDLFYNLVSDVNDLEENPNKTIDVRKYYTPVSLLLSGAPSSSRAFESVAMRVKDLQQIQREYTDVINSLLPSLFDDDLEVSKLTEHLNDLSNLLMRYEEITQSLVLSPNSKDILASASNLNLADHLLPLITDQRRKETSLNDFLDSDAPLLPSSFPVVEDLAQDKPMDDDYFTMVLMLKDLLQRRMSKVELKNLASFMETTILPDFVALKGAAHSFQDVKDLCSKIFYQIEGRCKFSIRFNKYKTRVTVDMMIYLLRRCTQEIAMERFDRLKQWSKFEDGLREHLQEFSTLNQRTVYADSLSSNRKRFLKDLASIKKEFLDSPQLTRFIKTVESYLKLFPLFPLNLDQQVKYVQSLHSDSESIYLPGHCHTVAQLLWTFLRPYKIWKLFPETTNSTALRRVDITDTNNATSNVASANSTEYYTLEIAAINGILNECIDMDVVNDHKCREVRIICCNVLYACTNADADTEIILPSKNIVLCAKSIQTISEERTLIIDVSGKDGRNSFASTENENAGTDGANGASGFNAGNITLILDNYGEKTCPKFKFLVDGGNGAPGQNGGNGKFGTDGHHGQTPPSTFNISSAYFYQGIRQSELGTDGTRGTSGENGGNAGLGGIGGTPGTVDIRRFSGYEIVVPTHTGKRGSNGANGEVGKPGAGGMHGKDGSDVSIISNWKLLKQDLSIDSMKNNIRFIHRKNFASHIDKYYLVGNGKFKDPARLTFVEAKAYTTFDHHPYQYFSPKDERAPNGKEGLVKAAILSSTSVANSSIKLDSVVNSINLVKQSCQIQASELATISQTLSLISSVQEQSISSLSLDTVMDSHNMSDALQAAPSEFLLQVEYQVPRSLPVHMYTASRKLSVFGNDIKYNNSYLKFYGSNHAYASKLNTITVKIMNTSHNIRSDRNLSVSHTLEELNSLLSLVDGELGNRNTWDPEIYHEYYSFICITVRNILIKCIGHQLQINMIFEFYSFVSRLPERFVTDDRTCSISGAVWQIYIDWKVRVLLKSLHMNPASNATRIDTLQSLLQQDTCYETDSDLLCYLWIEIDPDLVTPWASSTLLSKRVQEFNSCADGTLLLEVITALYDCVDSLQDKTFEKYQVCSNCLPDLVRILEINLRAFNISLDIKPIECKDDCYSYLSLWWETSAKTQYSHSTVQSWMKAVLLFPYQQPLTSRGFNVAYNLIVNVRSWKSVESLIQSPIVLASFVNIVGMVLLYSCKQVDDRPIFELFQFLKGFSVEMSIDEHTRNLFLQFRDTALINVLRRYTFPIIDDLDIRSTGSPLQSQLDGCIKILEELLLGNSSSSKRQKERLKSAKAVLLKELSKYSTFTVNEVLLLQSCYTRVNDIHRALAGASRGLTNNVDVCVKFCAEMEELLKGLIYYDRQQFSSLLTFCQNSINLLVSYYESNHPTKCISACRELMQQLVTIDHRSSRDLPFTLLHIFSDESVTRKIDRINLVRSCDSISGYGLDGTATDWIIDKMHASSQSVPAEIIPHTPEFEKALLISVLSSLNDKLSSHEAMDHLQNSPKIDLLLSISRFVGEKDVSVLEQLLYVYVFYFSQEPDDSFDNMLIEVILFQIKSHDSEKALQKIWLSHLTPTVRVLNTLAYQSNVSELLSLLRASCLSFLIDTCLERGWDQLLACLNMCKMTNFQSCCSKSVEANFWSLMCDSKFIEPFTSLLSEKTISEKAESMRVALSIIDSRFQKYWKEQVLTFISSFTMGLRGTTWISGESDTVPVKSNLPALEARFQRLYTQAINNQVELCNVFRLTKLLDEHIQYGDQLPKLSISTIDHILDALDQSSDRSSILVRLEKWGTTPSMWMDVTLIALLAEKYLLLCRGVMLPLLEKARCASDWQMQESSALNISEATIDAGVAAILSLETSSQFFDTSPLPILLHRLDKEVFSVTATAKEGFVPNVTPAVIDQIVSFLSRCQVYDELTMESFEHDSLLLWTNLIKSQIISNVVQQALEQIPEDRENYVLEYFLKSIYLDYGVENFENFLTFLNKILLAADYTQPMNFIELVEKLYYQIVTLFDVQVLIDEPYEKWGTVLKALVEKRQTESCEVTVESMVEGMQTKEIDPITNLPWSKEEFRKFTAIVLKIQNWLNDGDFDSFHVKKNLLKLRQATEYGNTRQTKEAYVCKNMDLALKCVLRAMYQENDKKAKTTQLTTIAMSLFMASSGIRSKYNEKVTLAQLKTGEGKTFIVACIAALKSICGYNVHVVSSNRDLAQEHVDEHAQFFEALFLKSDCNCRVFRTENDEMIASTPSAATYQKNDIVYGDVGSFERDYLLSLEEGDLFGKFFILKTSTPVASIDTSQDTYLIVDEVDFMAIDKCLSSLYLSSHVPVMKTLEALFINITAACSRVQVKDEVERKEKIENLKQGFLQAIKDGTIDIAPEMLSLCESQLEAFIENGIYAIHEMKPNTSFVFRNGKIVIMDMNSGVEEYSTRWTNALSCFLDIFYRNELIPESIRASFVSHKTFLQLYGSRVFGLTGTLGNPDTRLLINLMYPCYFVDIPRQKQSKFTLEKPKTNFDHCRWLKNIANDVIDKVETKRVVLVIAETVASASDIVKELERRKPNGCRLIEYVQDTDQAACADEFDSPAIIVATNKGGRGTDIKLHQTIVDCGGLHVIMTYLPESWRNVMQAFGRAGRNGQQGSGRFILLVDPSYGRYSTLQQFDEFVLELEKSRLQEQERRFYSKLLVESLPEIEVENDVLAQYRKLTSRALSELPKTISNDIKSFVLSRLKKEFGFFLMRLKTKGEVKLRHTLAIEDFNLYFTENRQHCLFDTTGLQHGTIEERVQLGRIYLQSGNVNSAYYIFKKILSDEGNLDYFGFAAIGYCVCLFDKMFNAEKFSSKEKRQRAFKPLVRTLRRLQALTAQYSGFIESVKFISDGHPYVMQYIGHNNLFEIQASGKIDVLSGHIALLQETLGKELSKTMFEDAATKVSAETSARIVEWLIEYNIFCDGQVSDNDALIKRMMDEHAKTIFKHVKRDKLQLLQDTIVNRNRNISSPSCVDNKGISLHWLRDFMYDSPSLLKELYGAKKVEESVRLVHATASNYKSVLQQLMEVWNQWCIDMPSIKQVPKGKAILEIIELTPDYVVLAPTCPFLMSLSKEQRDKTGNLDNSFMTIFQRFLDRGDFEIIAHITLDSFSFIRKPSSNYASLLFLPDGSLTDDQNAGKPPHLYVQDCVGKIRDNGCSVVTSLIFPFSSATFEAKQLHSFLHGLQIIEQLQIHPNYAWLDYQTLGMNDKTAEEQLLDEAVNIVKTKLKKRSEQEIKDLLALVKRNLTGVLGTLRNDDNKEVQCSLVSHKDNKVEDMFKNGMSMKQLPYFVDFGFDQFLVWNKERSWFDWRVMTVALVGLAQFVAGVICVALSPATGGALLAVGKFLIAEGINDMIFAAMAQFSGHFSWQSYLTQKAISVTMQFVCMGAVKAFKWMKNAKTAAEATSTAAEATVAAGEATTTAATNSATAANAATTVAVQQTTTEGVKNLGYGAVKIVLPMVGKAVMNQAASATIDVVMRGIKDNLMCQCVESLRCAHELYLQKSYASVIRNLCTTMSNNIQSVRAQIDSIKATVRARRQAAEAMKGTIMAVTDHCVRGLQQVLGEIADKGYGGQYEGNYLTIIKKVSEYGYMLVKSAMDLYDARCTLERHSDEFVNEVKRFTHQNKSAATSSADSVSGEVQSLINEVVNEEVQHVQVEVLDKMMSSCRGVLDIALRAASDKIIRYLGRKINTFVTKVKPKSDWAQSIKEARQEKALYKQALEEKIGKDATAVERVLEKGWLKIKDHFSEGYYKRELIKRAKFANENRIAGGGCEAQLAAAEKRVKENGMGLELKVIPGENDRPSHCVVVDAAGKEVFNSQTHVSGQSLPVDSCIAASVAFIQEANKHGNCAVAAERLTPDCVRKIESKIIRDVVRDIPSRDNLGKGLRIGVTHEQIGEAAELRNKSKAELQRLITDLEKELVGLTQSEKDKLFGNGNPNSDPYLDFSYALTFLYNSNTPSQHTGSKTVLIQRVKEARSMHHGLKDLSSIIHANDKTGFYSTMANQYRQNGLNYDPAAQTAMSNFRKMHGLASPNVDADLKSRRIATGMAAVSRYNYKAYTLSNRGDLHKIVHGDYPSQITANDLHEIVKNPQKTLQNVNPLVKNVNPPKTLQSNAHPIP